MKPLTPEQERIMRAESEGRLRVNSHGRWIIVGEARPARKDRERLLSSGLLDRYARRPL